MKTENQKVWMTPQLFHTITGVSISGTQLDLLEMGHLAGIPEHLSWEEKIKRWKRMSAVQFNRCKEEGKQRLLRHLREGGTLYIPVDGDEGLRIDEIECDVDDEGRETFYLVGECESFDSLEDVLYLYDRDNYGNIYTDKKYIGENAYIAVQCLYNSYKTIR